MPERRASRSSCTRNPPRILRRRAGFRVIIGICIISIVLLLLLSLLYSLLLLLLLCANTTSFRIIPAANAVSAAERLIASLVRRPRVRSSCGLLLIRNSDYTRRNARACTLRQCGTRERTYTKYLGHVTYFQLLASLKSRATFPNPRNTSGPSGVKNPRESTKCSRFPAAITKNCYCYSDRCRSGTAFEPDSEVKGGGVRYA